MVLPPRATFAALPDNLLESPANGSSVTALRPAFTWKTVRGATGYTAEIADNPNFYGKISSGRITLQRFTPHADLRVNTLYYWHVRVNTSGNDVEDSDDWRFWTPVTVIGPDDKAAVSLTPLFRWNAYKTGAVNDPNRSYRLQISEDASFNGATAIDASTTTPSFTVPAERALVGGKTYYWRVNVSSNDGTSGWSEARSFTTIPPPRVGPDLLAPGSGTSLDTYYPGLAWNPVRDATSYVVHYVATRADGTTSIEKISPELTTTSFQLNAFWGGDATAENATYEWWIEAKNLSGSASSVHATFVTPGRQAPPMPTLLTPADGTVVADLSPVFEWTPTTFTKTYRFEVGTDSTSSGIAGRLAAPTFSTNPNAPGSSFTYVADNASVYPLDYNTTYYWQVSAISVGGIATKSEIRSFRTPPAS
jgi:hypothetical protein